MLLDIIIGIAVAVIPLLATWITTQVIPWIKARTTAEQRRVAQALVQTAVYAAEQLHKSGVIEDRLEYVKDWLKDKLKLDAEQLRAMIEAAVMELRIKEEWAFGELVAEAEEGVG